MATILEGRKHARIIWTPTTLLHWMGMRGVGWVYPRRLRRKANRLLEQLCKEGHLIRRPEFHSDWGKREVAYMLPKGRNPRTVIPKELVYDPKKGGFLLSAKRAK